MKVAVFLNGLGLGGTEKAAVAFARGLQQRGHAISVLALEAGERQRELEADSIPVKILPAAPQPIALAFNSIAPDVIHAHVPGHPHRGDVLGLALNLLSRRIPVLSTNIFGQLRNPMEDEWTDFRLFISWTSCVQAARRASRALSRDFFRRASVVSYPVDPDDGPSPAAVREFRRQHGIGEKEILFGRISRPEPNKWTNLPVAAFRRALRRETHLKLLLREPPAAVRRSLQNAADRSRFLILPATSDQRELALTIASLDAALHTSSIGESFGYGIAEAMNYGRPVVVNSTPCLDQAQIELVRHGECGFVASTPSSIAHRLLQLARDFQLRQKFGEKARAHIRRLADPGRALDRLEQALQNAVARSDNSRLDEDIVHARAAAAYLDAHQFGHTWREQILLRARYLPCQAGQLRRALIQEWR